MWPQLFWGQRFWNRYLWNKSAANPLATVPALDFTLLAGVQTQSMIRGERRVVYWDYQNWIEVEEGETLSDPYLTVSPTQGVYEDDPIIDGTQVQATVTAQSAGTYTLVFGAETSGGSILRNQGTLVVS